MYSNLLYIIYSCCVEDVLYIERVLYVRRHTHAGLVQAFYTVECVLYIECGLDVRRHTHA
jgi:hypothetical protein